MALEITSLKNPRIKNLINLQKAKARREEGLFIVEGIREISLAQQSGFELDSLFICPEVYKADVNYPIELLSNDILHLPQAIFAKVAYRENTGGIIAVAKSKSLDLKNLPAKENPLYLILEKVEKPGNIGAMLRTADAAGVDAVIICDQAADFYNPNVIRSSVGCVFTVAVAVATNEEVLAWCKNQNVQIFGTALTASVNYTTVDYTKACAILMGSESFGLSDFWLKNSSQNIIIPMAGKIDSMNVSNAAAITIFEAVRQRGDNF